MNAVAPFILCGKLKPLMLRDRSSPGHIVNVSAMEGSFAQGTKTDKHPHTNMAKAALNMMTLTSARDYARFGIFMNAVDTGWVTDEDPVAARRPQARGARLSTSARHRRRRRPRHRPRLDAMRTGQTPCTASSSRTTAKHPGGRGRSEEPSARNRLGAARRTGIVRCQSLPSVKARLQGGRHPRSGVALCCASRALSCVTSRAGSRNADRCAGAGKIDFGVSLSSTGTDSIFSAPSSWAPRQRARNRTRPRRWWRQAGHETERSWARRSSPTPFPVA